ncbi:MAG: hypothetical protein ACTSWI_05395 [Alphaproteobacteria bacterium]
MNGAYSAGTIVGAILATFLLSRLFLWLSRKWLSGTAAIFTGRSVTLVIVFLAAGFGLADGGSFRADAVLIYLLPWALWLVFDFTRFQVKAKADGPVDPVEPQS